MHCIDKGLAAVRCSTVIVNVYANGCLSCPGGALIIPVVMRAVGCSRLAGLGPCTIEALPPKQVCEANAFNCLQTYAVFLKGPAFETDAWCFFKRVGSAWVVSRSCSSFGWVHWQIYFNLESLAHCCALAGPVFEHGMLCSCHPVCPSVLIHHGRNAPCKLLRHRRPRYFATPSMPVRFQMTRATPETQVSTEPSLFRLLFRWGWPQTQRISLRVLTQISADGHSTYNLAAPLAAPWPHCNLTPLSANMSKCRCSFTGQLDCNACS